jgi:hypothetical protein
MRSSGITSINLGVRKWCGIAGGVASRSDWGLWADGQRDLLSELEIPKLDSVPSRIARRLNVLGKSVLSVCEKTLEGVSAAPAVIATSRHGDLPAMDALIRSVRQREDMSPTAFAYSVHNRFSSLVSILNDFHGINGAYSSVRDGFPLALAEAASLINGNRVRQVLLIAYEPEIPDQYHEIIEHEWRPHAVALLLDNEPGSGRFALTCCPEPGIDAHSAGSCLPFIRAMITKEPVSDGRWRYQFSENS